MSDLLERVKSSQACMGLIGTITLPAELHHALVAEVEALRAALAIACTPPYKVGGTPGVVDETLIAGVLSRAAEIEDME